MTNSSATLQRPTNRSIALHRGARRHITRPTVLCSKGSRLFAAPKRLRVLLVEDEFILARFLRRSLTERGHDCTAVNSGAIAITTMERETFDVVMSDMRLGKEDGADVLERARELLPTARRVLMTGALDPDVAARLVADV